MIQNRTTAAASRETLVNSSYRRKPVSNAVKPLDSGMRRNDGNKVRQIFLKLLPGLLLVVSTVMPVRANDVEKVLFLVVEKDEIIASNTLAGRFDRLNLQAKEKVRDYQVSKAVAVVVTNQRLVAYGALAGGWRGTRLLAGEKVERVEAEDYSVTVVTNDRILNFYGRSGAWSNTRRGVQLR